MFVWEVSTALSNEATLALSRGPAPSVPGNIFSPQMPSAAGGRTFVAKKCCEEGGPFSSAKVALFLSAVNIPSLRFNREEEVLLRSGVFLVRNGRASWYSTILSGERPYVRFDPGCMFPA